MKTFVLSLLLISFLAAPAFPAGFRLLAIEQDAIGPSAPYYVNPSIIMGKSTGYIQLLQPHRFGAAAPVETVSTASTYGRGLHAKDTDKATNYVDYWLIVPPDFDSSVEMKLSYLAFEAADIIAASSTVHWVLSVISILEGSAFNGSPANPIDCTYTAWPAIAANTVGIVSDVILTGWAAVLIPGQLMQVRCERDGDTADTADAATYSPIICISYGKSQP
jgi:hypothetical protein